MATSADLFPGARVSTHRIAPNVRGMHVEPQLGTVVGRDNLLDTDDRRVACKCGCGGYWTVRWDSLGTALGSVVSFLAHDLTALEVVDQLAFRVEEDPE